MPRLTSQTEPVILKPAQPGVAAHIQHTTLRIEEYVPFHPTRQDDKYYHLFDQARARMVALGIFKCKICGTDQNVEAHHSEVEFSMAAGVDVQKFAVLHPDLFIKDDDTFRQFVAGEHNLCAYCRTHHTGIRGIHVLPWPLFSLQAYWLDPKGPAVDLQGDTPTNP